MLQQLWMNWVFSRNYPALKVALLGIALALVSAPNAWASCDPSLYPIVTVSLGAWQTNGFIPATATNTYPRNDGYRESLTVYVDVVDDAHKVWGPTPVTSGAPQNINVPTACLPSGSHTVIAVGGNCAKTAQTSAGFSVSSEPSIGASLANGFDAVGNGTLNIDYNFPNTSVYTQREIFVELDGVYITNSKRQPVNVSGSYAYGIAITCLPTGAHTFTVRARPCGDASRDRTADVPVQRTPLPA